MGKAIVGAGKRTEAGGKRGVKPGGGRTPGLVSKVRRTILRRSLAVPGDLILVACSGGADSTALLHVLRDLGAEFSFRLAVAHFDHGLRASSGRDARFVHELAASFGLPFHYEKRDVRAAARKHGWNLEEAGRRLRYDFLCRAAGETGAARIATGHTLDDQAETVLMRILRGSGPRGLAGIAPIREGLIIRPLIEARRKEIEAFLRARKIVPCEDETNRDRAFLRNDVRRRLVPYLERNYEPAVAEKLGRMAEILEAEDRFLEAHVRRILPGLVQGESAEARLNADALAFLPTGLSRRCIRAFIEDRKGDLLRVSFDDVENVRTLREGKTAVLPGGLRLTREGAWIGRAAGRRPGQRIPKGFRLRWDGTAPLGVVETGAVFAARLFRRGSLSKFPFDDACRVFLDAGRLVFPLIVRSPRAGDRYRPIGAPGRRKVNEMLRGRGVPVSERGLKTVFESGGEIAWVEGLPAAEAFRIGPSTRRVLRIEKDVS